MQNQAFIYLFSGSVTHQSATGTHAIQLVLFSNTPYSAKEGQAVDLFISRPALIGVCSVLHGEKCPSKNKFLWADVFLSVSLSFSPKVVQTL